MQKKDTEQILLYYGKIEKQLDSVNMELAELQDRYSPIKGLAMDGMPHGSTPGDSTASLAVQLADNEAYQNRENELIVRRVVLKSDLQEIRQKLDRLNDDYKTILKGRYVYADRSLQKTWESIAISIGTKKITAQRWKDAALVVLGGMFDEIPMIEEILSRAYDARDEKGRYAGYAGKVIENLSEPAETVARTAGKGTTRKAVYKGKLVKLYARVR